jgi:L,D-peptidoglycan transpeptidase YkuD (ErfK/YbiS/YcfS/YnhG family)
MRNSSCLSIDCRKKHAFLGDLELSCRIGKGGWIDAIDGKEGDQKTPLGEYILRWGFYRADRLSHPATHYTDPLTWRALQSDDGWCDDVNTEAYNRFIRLPSPLSHEKLWREDGAYDLILVISHNDSPPEKGLGSAVFIHVAQPDDRETLGCIAFAPDDWVKLLPKLYAGLAVNIHA